MNTNLTIRTKYPFPLFIFSCIIGIKIADELVNKTYQSSKYYDNNKNNDILKKIENGAFLSYLL